MASRVFSRTPPGGGGLADAAQKSADDSQHSDKSSPGPAGGRAGRPGVANVAALKAGNGPALGNPAGPRQSDFGGQPSGSAACGGATRGAAAEGQRIQRDGKPASQSEPDGNAPVTPVEQEDCPAHQTYYPTAGMVPGEIPGPGAPKQEPQGTPAVGFDSRRGQPPWASSPRVARVAASADWACHQCLAGGERRTGPAETRPRRVSGLPLDGSPGGQTPAEGVTARRDGRFDSPLGVGSAQGQQNCAVDSREVER